MLSPLYFHIVGLTAARNMLGGNEEIDTIPFFWTSQYGKSIRYCGRCLRVAESSCFLPSDFYRNRHAELELISSE